MFQINNFAAIHGGKIMTIEEVAVGFIKVANETMCRPIRALTEVCHRIYFLIYN